VPALAGWQDAGVVDAPGASTGTEDHREDSTIMHPVQSQEFMHTLALEARLREQTMARHRLARGAAPIRPASAGTMRQLAVSIGHAIHRFVDPRGYAMARLNETRPATPDTAAGPATMPSDPRQPDIMPQPDIASSDERIAS
jgi:hypothetical protein